MTKAEAIKIAMKKIHADPHHLKYPYFNKYEFVEVFTDAYQEVFKMHCLVAATENYICRVFFREESDNVEVMFIGLKDCSFTKYN